MTWSLSGVSSTVTLHHLPFRIKAHTPPYLLYGYINGSVPAHVIQSDGMSRQKARNTAEDVNTDCTETLIHTDKDFQAMFITKLLCLHEDMNDRFNEMCNKITDFQFKYENDV